jgi:hypothetical protein
MLKSTYWSINGRHCVATFMYLHLTHKVLSLPNTDLSNVPFSRNLPMLNKGLQYYLPFPVAQQSLKDLGCLTYKRFLYLFRHMVGLLGRIISPSQGLYLHRPTQHRKTRTYIHALGGIRTHDPGNQLAKDPHLRPHGHCDRLTVLPANQTYTKANHHIMVIKLGMLLHKYFHTQY